MTSYDSAVAQLYQLGFELARSSGHKFDLELVRVLLRAFDHPERRFPSVLVAGTNGKGSTSATLASILQAAGRRTALYTSPHLLRVNERICVDGEEIRDEDFAAAYDQVETVVRELLSAGELPWHPSFFEMLTVMAFTYFAGRQVAIAVLEVGMGGRLDATNVVDPLLSIITDISLDHEKFLGNTIREIAREKAGIIRPGGILITLPQHPEANEVIGNTVLECGARSISAVPFVPPVSPGAEPIEPARYPLDFMGERIEVDSPLTGRHQWRNLALAIAAAQQLNGLGFKMSPPDVARGIRQTRWPGRFQIVPADPAAGTPEIVLDVAHNPAGAWALRAALSDRYRGSAGKPFAAESGLVMLFGAMRDKPIREIASILFPVARQVIVTRAATPRSAAPEEIRAMAGGIMDTLESETTVAAGMERAFSLAGPAGVVVITGSIYIVGEAMAALRALGTRASSPQSK
jgi:dihydrofolate synthase/folylpolyglutamate synthase